MHWQFFATKKINNIKVLVNLYIKILFTKLKRANRTALGYLTEKKENDKSIPSNGLKYEAVKGELKAKTNLFFM